ncbi:uncharacterized protein J3R85_019844 [Psidium guajava]|nr:uncharacterized protein J3R85_019844 [Psidium guajava]
MDLQNHHKLSLVLSTDAKPRLKWVPKLHHRFLKAVAQLGESRQEKPEKFEESDGHSCVDVVPPEEPFTEIQAWKKPTVRVLHWHEVRKVNSMQQKAKRFRVQTNIKIPK